MSGPDLPSLSDAILETVDLPLVVMGADLVVESINDAFLIRFGVSRDDTVGRRLFDLGNGQWNIPELRRLLGEILPRQSRVRNYRVEHDFERIGRRIMRLNAQRLARPGSKDLILLAISDETEREGLRRELEARIELADKITDSVREALLVLDANLRVQSVSGSFYQLFKVDPDRTVGQLVYELGNGQWDIPALRRLLEDILPRQRSFDDYEVTHTFEQLGKRVMLLNGRRLDHVDLILLAIRDVTDVRESEARISVALRDSEELLDRAFEAAGMGAWDCDLVGDRCHFDARAQKLYRLKSDVIEHFPESIGSAFHPDDKAAMSEAIRRATDVNGDGSYGVEYRIAQDDGTYRWLRARGKARFEGEGATRRAVRIVGASSDVTFEKEAQTHLAEDLRDTSLLRDLAVRMVPEESEEKHYREILDAAIQIMQSQAGTLQIYEPETHSLLLLVTQNFERKMTDHFRRVDASSNTACGLALRTGQRSFADFDQHGDEACRMHVEAGYRSAQATPLVSRSGAPIGMLNTHWSAAKHRPSERQLRILDLLARQAADLIERHRTSRALRQSEERFRQFSDASSDVLWIRSTDSLRWEYLSPAFESIYGMSVRDALTGDTLRNWMDLIVQEDRDLAMENIEAVRRGERVRFEYRIRRPDGELRWLRNTDFPMRNSHGAVERVGGIGHDITDIKRAEEQQQVLVAELQHRTRNLMGLVRSMAEKTGRASADLEDFRRRFRDRIDALARVQGLLSRLHSHDRLNFDELLRSELNAMDADANHVTLQGPTAVRLRSSTVQVLALALHELATNAVKYGALGQPGARLTVSWRVELLESGAPWLFIDWRESGVRTQAHQPTPKGQGRELIEEALPYQVGARTSHVLTGDGLHCTIAIEASNTGARHE